MAKTEAGLAGLVDRIIAVIEKRGGSPLSPENREIVEKLTWHLYGGRIPSKDLANKISRSLKNPSSPDYRGMPEYKDAQARCAEYLREYHSGDLNVDPDPFHLNPPESKFS